jgi:phage-related protein
MSIVLPVKMQQMKESNQTFFLEIYDIALRTGTIHLVASDTNITFNGVQYLAVPIQRESLTRSMDNITDNCQLSIGDVDYGLLSYVMKGYDPRMSNVLVRRIQYPDSLSNPSINEWLYYGFLDELSFADGTFTCKIMSRFPQIDVPNRQYSLHCNSEFADDQCRASKSTTNVSVTGVSGNTLYLARSFNQNFWLNGVCTIEGESRIITQSNGNWIQLNVNFLQDRLVGKTAQISRGCNKTKTDCQRFGNLARFSGFPAIPFESVYR